ncbi:MAG: hypothetical protein JWN48_598 [Myxococcaceae bacterium]|nr:hypothetical protein [Myxococcaceae bacterium]
MTRQLSALLLLTLATSCGSDDSPKKTGLPTATVDRAVADYKALVNANYADVLVGAQAMQTAIDAFVANPTAETHAAAKAAWIKARLPYAPSEAFRFYDGPIDNPTNGPEFEINSWPLDENYIDYTRDDPMAGIVNDPKVTLSLAEIDMANTVGGEKNISNGWHAIEFLLWGQDDEKPGLGAGKRPYTDYVAGAGGTALNQDRRGQYLKFATSALIGHLSDVANQWKPGDPSNFAASFGITSSDGSDPKKVFVGDLIRSIGSMANAELSGQRMTVAYIDRDQEDEHSCFSDTTATDLLGDGVGLQNVWLNRYGSLDGVGLEDIVREVDPALADKTSADFATAIAQLQILQDLQVAGTPIDVILKSDDSAPGRVAMLAAIKALKLVGSDMEAINKELGLGVELEKPSVVLK